MPRQCGTHVHSRSTHIASLGVVMTILLTTSVLRKNVTPSGTLDEAEASHETAEEHQCSASW